MRVFETKSMNIEHIRNQYNKIVETKGFKE